MHFYVPDSSKQSCASGLHQRKDNTRNREELPNRSFSHCLHRFYGISYETLVYKFHQVVLFLLNKYCWCHNSIVLVPYTDFKNRQYNMCVGKTIAVNSMGKGGSSLRLVCGSRAVNVEYNSLLIPFTIYIAGYGSCYQISRLELSIRGRVQSVWQA